jgi:hypothetical protein
MFLIKPQDGVSVEFSIVCRRTFLVKNNPVKNFPPPGIFFERRIIRRRILLA